MRQRWVLPALACCLLLVGCSRRPQTPKEQGAVLEEAQVYTFSDGVSVDRWQDRLGADRYCFPDGTELLYVEVPAGPGDHANGQEDFRDLNGTARDAILAWFKDRGLLYDVEQELERAYMQYLTCQKNRKLYWAGRLEQTVRLVSSNRQIVCFETSVARPSDELQIVEVTSLKTVFDRAGGEEVSVWDLFTVPEEEARRQLLSRLRPADIADPEEARVAIAAALRPEYISIGADCIEVWFPKGTLPEGELDGWVLRYVDDPALFDILQPWAIPDSPENAG